MSRNFDILHREEAPGEELRPTPVPNPNWAEPDVNEYKHSNDHSSAVEDEITVLVQRVFIYSGALKTPEVVAFCGVDKGDGCSWVCARTSEGLALQGPGSVCVVDANLRSPSLHKHFQMENAAGFADAMRGSRSVREFTRPTRHSNLWLMTGGSMAGKEPNGALKPAALRGRFSELRDEFDYVLIDTPPISSYADAMLLGQITDGAILVVSSNSTRRGPARVAKESLEAAGVEVLGAVLNRRTYPIPQAIYRKL